MTSARSGPPDRSTSSRAAARPAIPARSILEGSFSTAEEFEQHPIERGRVLDHEAVGGAADDDELGGRDPVGEILAVAARREDVLGADQHGGGDLDAGQAL